MLSTEEIEDAITVIAIRDIDPETPDLSLAYLTWLKELAEA